MKRWLAVLASSMALASVAPAQERATLTVPPGQELIISAPLNVVNGYGYNTAGAPAYHTAPANATHPNLNKVGLHCNSHHHWFGCGNLHSEATFIFGSCRSFYGEPCEPKPPGTGFFGRLNPFNYSYQGGQGGNGKGGYGHGQNGNGGCTSCGQRR
jgi:hypothetical protein